MVQELLRRFWHGLTDRIDGPLMLITLIIMGFGLATIYSATHDASDRTTAQVMNMLVGIGVMWAVAQIPPQKLMRFAVPLYVLGVILLVLVFFSGSRSTVPGAGCRSALRASSRPRSSRSPCR